MTDYELLKQDYFTFWDKYTPHCIKDENKDRYEIFSASHCWEERGGISRSSFLPLSGFVIKVIIMPDTGSKYVVSDSGYISC